MIGAVPYSVCAAAIRRRLGDLVSHRQELLLDFGLSSHAFGEVWELVSHDLGSRSMYEQAAIRRVLLPHEPNRLWPSREEPTFVWNSCHNGVRRQWDTLTTQLCLRLRTRSRRQGDVGAIVSLVKEGFPHELFEQRLACGSVDLPQATRLREGESQPGHLAVFLSNTGDKRFKWRHTSSPASCRTR